MHKEEEEEVKQQLKAEQLEAEKAAYVREKAAYVREQAAYVSIRQHTSACVREQAAYVSRERRREDVAEAHAADAEAHAADVEEDALRREAQQVRIR